MAAGGLTSAAGMLNAIVTAKFLLLAAIVKLVTFQPVDQYLTSPIHTGIAMAIGFFALFIATWVHRRLPIPSLTLMPDIGGPRMYLALTIVFLVCSYTGLLIGMAPGLSGDGVQTGGILGIARNFSLFKSFPVVTSLYFAWSRDSKRFMTHPLVLLVLATTMIFGIFGTGKLEAMEPVVFYLAVSASRYGIWDKRLISLVCGGVAYYALIIFPYSQYVRMAGGREGDLTERITTMRDVLWSQLTDPNFRDYTYTQIRGRDPGYLGIEALEPFSRLAMIGQADKLITATDETAPSGWYTIVWGFGILTPSFIYPDKPIVPAGNYLGQLTGEANPQDQLTQFSHGIMANFYNAFLYKGVFLGTLIFFCGFYYLFRLWFRDPRWVTSPTGTTLWYLILVGSFEHSLAEESFPGIMSRLTIPFIVLVFYWAARVLSFLLPDYGEEAAAHLQTGYAKNNKSGFTLAEVAPAARR